MLSTQWIDRMDWASLPCPPGLTIACVYVGECTVPAYTTKAHILSQLCYYIMGYALYPYIRCPTALMVAAVCATHCLVMGYTPAP